LRFFSNNDVTIKYLQNSRACSISAVNLPSYYVAQILLDFCRQFAVRFCPQVLLDFCCQSTVLLCEQVLSTERKQNGTAVDVRLLTFSDQICCQSVDSLLTFCLLGILLQQFFLQTTHRFYHIFHFY